jgi:hypothetical protein
MRPAASPLAGVPPATRVPFYSPLGDPHAPRAPEVAQFARSGPVRPDFTVARPHYLCRRAVNGGLPDREGLAHKATAGCPALFRPERRRSGWPALPGPPPWPRSEGR